ncbi:hypothetical protein BJV82DRAFT_662786 [Fennellomyces sp. T-0311]|nr:hypothetical protein BJV82DRAFT_662786 [Fennellomyces sp. T-0311]
MTSFYNHQRGYYTSSKPFYKRQNNQYHNHHTPSRAAPPRPHHNQPRYRYYQPCSATHIDDLIYGPAITMAMSERSIFAPFEHPATIHMPPVSKKPHSRRSSRKSLYASLYDPLETTTKEPLEPYDDPITAHTSDDGSSSSSSSTSSLSTTRINDSSHHTQRRSSNSKPVTPQTHRPEHYYHHHHHHPQQYPEPIQQYPCYYPLPPPPPQYAYYHYYQVPAMTTSPTASSSSSTSVAEMGGSNATAVTITDHPYANTAGRTDPEEMLADDLHRRASTISDAITTASSAEICRRFSNGSTSSTAASSMVTLPDEKQAIAAPVVSPLATPPPPSDEPTVITSSSDEEDEPSPVAEKSETQPDIEPDVEETEPEEDSDDDTLPVWADPDRVRENPTRYEFVKEYMKTHSIPKTSSMPLPNTCTFYFSETLATKHQKTPTANYMSTVRPMFDCQTVWDFSSWWRRYKQVCSRPSQMQHNQNLYCFLKGVAPMWEDVTNKNGGRLTLCPARADLDDLFDWVLASFVGGKLSEDGMVGVVLSKRSRGDRIELWLDGSASMGTMSTLK